jgi:hypothetical protein
MSTSKLSNKELQALLKKATWNARAMFWAGVFPLALLLFTFLYMQLALLFVPIAFS